MKVLESLLSVEQTASLLRVSITTLQYMIYEHRMALALEWHCPETGPEEQEERLYGAL
ncbi:MAG TPA: hypothetical protein VFC37_04225 [Terracidiphilus sp.]|nr:hypothetical protein [Terracidiphilus sp.]